MVTARSDTHDVVAGLEAGADDYVTKPFVAKELAARIRALLRRSRPDDAGSSVISFGDVEIEPDAGVVRRAGEEVHCTRTEFRLLSELAEHPGKVLSREHLLERVWGYDYFGDGRLVDVHVRTAPDQDRSRPGQPPIHPDRAGHGLQAGGLTGGSGPRHPTGRSPSGPRTGPGAPGCPTGLGLRARVTATFAIGAFVLSTLMAGITYFTARQSYLNERQGADQRQTFANALLVQNALRSPGTEPDQLIGSAGPLPGSLLGPAQPAATGTPRRSRWARAPSPAGCRRSCSSGTPASQIVSVGGAPQLAIGVPLPAVHAAYFEFFSLDELEGTLRTLAFALAAAALVTTVAGAALGRWASGRALRPLGGVTEAAVAVAGGELDTRVEAGDDVDLQELASAFNRMTANLQDRIEREARFTSDVSHELRSPLTTLTATVGILEGHRDELSPGPAARWTSSTATCTASPGWSTTCWRSRGSTPARPSSRSTRSIPASWCAVPVGASAPVGPGRPSVGGGLPRGGRAGRGWPAPPGGQAPVRAGDGQPDGERQPLCRGRGQGDGGAPPARPGPTGDEPRTIRVIVEDRGPGDPRTTNGTTSSSASTGGVGPVSGHRARAPGSGCPWWPSTSASTAGAVHIEDAPGGGSRFIVELPLSSAGTTSGTRRERRRQRPTVGAVAVLVAVGGGDGLRDPRRPRSPTAIAKARRALPPPRPGHPDHDRHHPAPRGRRPEPIYLVAQNQHLFAVSRDVRVPANLTQILGALLEGPTSAEAELGLQSFLTPKTTVTATVTGGIATVDFSTNPVQVVGHRPDPGHRPGRVHRHPVPRGQGRGVPDRRPAHPGARGQRHPGLGPVSRSTYLPQAPLP